MHYFCTYFDHRYLHHGLALHQSLQQHCKEFSLYILCLSDECYTILKQLQLPSVTLIPLNELEAYDHALLSVKQNRSRIEYYFTCTPSIMLYVLHKFSEINLITYIDADLYFFSDPASLFDEIGENSVAIIPHRFPRKLSHLEQFGKYNCGWISFRRNENGIACLKWYKSKCIEWCYDIPEERRYGDQKYLNFFSEHFRGVTELQHKGANLAPWNIDNYAIAMAGQNVEVDGEPLICFHFHALRRLNSFIFDSGLSQYKARLTKDIKAGIYIPYLHVLCKLQRKFENKLENDPIRIQRRDLVQRIHNLFPGIVDASKSIFQLLTITYTRTLIIYFQK